MLDEDLPSGPELFRQLAGRAGIDSAFGSHDLQPNLSSDRINSSAARLTEHVLASLPENEQASLNTDSLMRMASDALNKFRDSDTLDMLPIHDRIVVEAVVIADGSRPVVDFTPNGLDLNNVSLGDWDMAIAGQAAKIEQAAQSVGAVMISSNNLVVGTGFSVADGLIMTNKHVLTMHLGRRDNTQPTGWCLKTSCKINFAQERDAQDERSFTIKEIAYVSPDTPVGGSSALRRDVCLLRCEESDNFPAPLSIFSDIGKYEKDRDICLIGFPTRPRAWSSASPPPSGYETINVITSLFRDRFGFKRLSIGEIEAIPGFFTEDANKKKIFAHDASTLRGTSGACVLDINTYGDRVFGLHFGGRPRDKNYAHALASFQQDLAGFGLTFSG